jgi:hypothetical protein
MGLPTSIFSFLFRIFSYSLIFCLKSLFIIVNIIKNLIDSVKTNLASYILTIINFGEENLIRDRLKNLIKKPDHIAVIISKYEYKLYSIVKILAWCKYSEIKYITIYDPYDYIKLDRNFKQTISQLFNDVSIYYDESNTIESTKTDSKCNLSIFVVSFFQANNNLVKNIVEQSKVNYEKDNEGNSNSNIVSKLPSSLVKFVKDESSNVSKRKSYKTIEKYYTLKKASYYPDVVICQKNTNMISLYGFPFSLIESSEFM